jgi:DNA-binding NtrC family response regulator
MTKEVIEYFMRYSWPGNVRELENVIERLVVTSEGNQLTIKDLPSELYQDKKVNSSSGVFVTKLMPLREATALAEYQLIKQALKEGGSTYEAARTLGVDQSTIVRKMKRYKELIN